jgi:prostaglandin-H2 D-isomerase / glutathione transferase
MLFRVFIFVVLLNLVISYRLAYFNGKARAEIIRYIFKVAKVPFVDDRMAPADYATRKANGEFRANFDRLPVLYLENNQAVGQSKAIERYLAKKFGLMGSTDEEALQVDVICEHCRDVKDKYFASRVGKSGDDLVKAKQTFVSQDLPAWLGKIDKVIKPGGYCVGSKLSLADLYMFNMAYDYFDPSEEMTKIINDCKNIKASADCAKEALKEHLDSRPVTPW